MVIGWTGHRPDVFLSGDDARQHVEGWAEYVLARWPGASFLCGGQRGVDLWAAHAALARGAAVALVLPSPPERFAHDWLAADRDVLADAISRSTTIRVVDVGGALGPLAYDRRNEIVAREADLLIAVWTGLRRGGTFYTICAGDAFGTRRESTILPSAAGISITGRGV